jgi:hypothetical protein
VVTLKKQKAGKRKRGGAAGEAAVELQGEEAEDDAYVEGFNPGVQAARPGKSQGV